MGENRFQIRHGSKAPEKSDLLPYEFGYDKTNKKLYMGQEEENPLLVNPDPATLKTLGIEDEIALLEGVTSPVQTQLNDKAKNVHTHSTSDITSGTLPITRGGTGVTSVAEIGLLSYPVGSIYVSTNSTSPAELFGGTWTQIKDRFLLGASDSYVNGTTGGEAAHTLTISEMPNHDHTVRTTRTESYPAYWHSTHTGSTDSSKGWAYLSTAGSANSGVGSLYVEKVGGGAAHNNMPPYLAVFIWQRTA